MKSSFLWGIRYFTGHSRNGINIIIGNFVVKISILFLIINYFEAVNLYFVQINYFVATN